MTLHVWTYLIYLGLSIAATIWVARTLHRNGRIFLVDCFHGNTDLADSVNHLLVVGFYLINVGFVALALRFGVEGAAMAFVMGNAVLVATLVWQVRSEHRRVRGP